jgi:hypothetical protein
VEWDGTILLDARLPMGASFSAAAMCRLSAAIAQAVETKQTRAGQSAVVDAYVDDFIAVSPTADAGCPASSALEAALNRVGLPISEKKAAAMGPPGHNKTYLGLVLHLGDGETSVPEEKRRKLRNAVRHALDRAPTIRSGQELAGKLAWVAASVLPARAALQNIYDDVGAHSRASRVVWSDDSQEELRWWCAALRDDRMTRYPWPPPASEPGVRVTSDASPSGFGYHWGTEARWGTWPEAGQAAQQTHLEALAALEAIAEVAARHPGQLVRLVTDNEGVRHSLAARRAREKRLNAIVLATMEVLVLHRCHLRVERIEGERNVIADALSRQRLEVCTGLTMKRVTPRWPS